MSLIPRRPFHNIEGLFNEEWPDWPRRFYRGLRIPEFSELRTPRMDIYEKGDDIVAEVELPGIDPKDIDVSVSQNVLRIEAKKEEAKEEKGKGYFKKELRKGYFKRAVPLPVEVLEEKASAEYEGGILKVTVPKKKPKKLAAEEEKKVKIKVKTA